MVYEIGDKIVFIPLRCMSLLCIDKSGNNSLTLRIPDERECFSGSRFNYIYKRDERYLGIYSNSQHCIFEIDLQDFSVSKQEIEYDATMYEWLNDRTCKEDDVVLPLLFWAFLGVNQ